MALTVRDVEQCFVSKLDAERDESGDHIYYTGVCTLLRLPPHIAYWGMETFPKDLAEFESWFSSEQAC